MSKISTILNHLPYLDLAVKSFQNLINKVYQNIHFYIPQTKKKKKYSSNNEYLKQIKLLQILKININRKDIYET